MKPLRLWLSVGLLLVPAIAAGGFLVPALARDIAEPPPPALLTPHWYDLLIDAPSEVAPLRSAALSVAAGTNQRLWVEQGWEMRPVVFAARQLRVAAFLTGMEQLTGRRWYGLGERTWILASSAEAARQREQLQYQRTARGGISESNQRAGRRIEELVDALTADQWGRLAVGEKLSARDLTPRQWGLIREALVLHMQDPAGPKLYTPRPAALQGQLFLALDTAGPGPDLIQFYYPSVGSGFDGTPHLSMKVARGENGSWINESARWPRKPLAFTSPASVTQDADYRSEAPFQRPLELSNGRLSWAEVIAALQRRTNACFLVQGAWLTKPVPLSVQNETPARIMDQMRQRYGGRWKRVETLWVFVTPEAVEGKQRAR